MKLSKMAAQLEKAANIKDDETINAGHDAMMDLYGIITDAIDSVFPQEERADEGGVLEFAPQ